MAKNLWYPCELAFAATQQDSLRRSDSRAARSTLFVGCFHPLAPLATWKSPSSAGAVSCGCHQCESASNGMMGGWWVGRSAKGSTRSMVRGYSIQLTTHEPDYPSMHRPILPLLIHPPTQPWLGFRQPSERWLWACEPSTRVGRPARGSAD